jgi:hypothetical protein
MGGKFRVEKNRKAAADKRVSPPGVQQRSFAVCKIAASLKSFKS